MTAQNSSLNKPEVCIILSTCYHRDRFENQLKIAWYSRVSAGDFLGGAVVKNPLANAGDVGSSPGPGRFHMLQSN